MSSDSSRDRLTRLYLTHAADAWRLAGTLCPDPERAQRCAERALLKSFATFRDLRSPLAFEASLRRAVVETSRESSIARLVKRIRGATPVPDDTGEMWARLQAQPHRRKAALVLRYLERLTEDQVADVLGCSTAMARALIARGLRDLAAGDSSYSADVIATELMRTLAQRAQVVRVPSEPDSSLLARAAARRRLAVVTLALLGVAFVVAGVRVAGAALDNEPDELTPEVRPSAEPGSFEEVGISHVQVRPRALPGSTAIATGEIAGDRWHFIAYEQAGELCMEVAAGSEFRSSQCIPRPSGVFETFVGADESHDATFIYGYTAEAVAHLEIETDEETSRTLKLIPAPEEVRDLITGRFFIAVVAERLVPSETVPAPGEYAIRTVLRAESEDGGPLQHRPLYLVRPD